MVISCRKEGEGNVQLRAPTDRLTDCWLISNHLLPFCSRKMFRIGDAAEEAAAATNGGGGYLDELTVFGDFDADDPDFAPLPNSRPRSR